MLQNSHMAHKKPGIFDSTPTPSSRKRKKPIPTGPSDSVTRPFDSALFQQILAPWRQTLDAVSDCVCIVDLQCRIVWLNKALAECSGLIEDNYVGQTCHKLLCGDEEPPPDCPLARLLQDGEEHVTEFGNYTFPGSFSVTVAPLRDATGRLVGSVLIARDITDRKRAETMLERLRETQVEAEKLAATGCMAARVAHEISNPLAGIQNAFYLIQDAVPETHPDYDMVEQIDREIERIASIVRQMYSLYSPQGQKPVDIVVADIMQDVLLVVEPLRRERGLRFDMPTIPSHLTVHMPRGSLHQVVYNLVINAVEASPYGEKVTIGVRLANEKSPAGTIEISIGNQGEEVPQECRHRIFEPFFTLKRGDPANESLGLGLSIVKSIVQSVGGGMEFESVSGQGTVFRVLLPQGLQLLKG